MKFNQFIWNTFIASANGNKSIFFFENIFSLYQSKDESLIAFLDRWSSSGTLRCNSFAEEQIGNSIEAIAKIKECQKLNLALSVVGSFQDARKLFCDLSNIFIKEMENEKKYIFKKINYLENEFEEEREEEQEEDEFDLFALDDIETLSIALNCLYPKYFFPYHFYPNFYALKKIFLGFGIYLPPVPKKNDTGERYFYYLELCESVYNYWTDLKLDEKHIPAFLYDFAPNVVDISFPSIVSLDNPKRAWFIGGGINHNGDFDYLDKIDSDSRSFWQGNNDTEVGDIIILYCLSPRSHIHSIWRALRNGDVEPFFHFYSTIWMGFPQKTIPISYSEMREDEVLKEFSLVKGSMQGINGRLIPKKYYDRILFILKTKGMDISNLPKLENISHTEIKLKNEKDVETKVLEPLLLNLGFSETDWRRQVSLRVGRSEKVIPDYLIFPQIERHNKSVKSIWVWEAKYSVKSNAQLRVDFEQVVSYARLVCAEGVSLLSIEGLWICQAKYDFKFEKCIFFSREQMLSSDGVNEIRRLASRKVLCR